VFILNKKIRFYHEVRVRSRNLSHGIDGIVDSFPRAWLVVEVGWRDRDRRGASFAVRWVTCEV